MLRRILCGHLCVCAMCLCLQRPSDLCGNGPFRVKTDIGGLTALLHTTMTHMHDPVFAEGQGSEHPPPPTDLSP